MKLFLSLFLVISAALPSFAAQEECLAKSQELFNAEDYYGTKLQLTKCLAVDPKDTDALISLGGVEMILGEFNEASTSFTTALKYLDPKSSYNAYVYSLMGDIAIRATNLNAAQTYYSAALRYQPANINALVGSGICLEKIGDKQGAADFYKKALAVDFTNIVARERLIGMEPDILNSAELLRTLKERNIIDPAAAAYSTADVELLGKIIHAERDRAIEYLSSKYNGKIPDGLTVERDSGKIYVRKMLTLTGYKDVVTKLSDEAKKWFITKGVSPNVIFKLRDLSGKEIFDSQGNLNDSGLSVYTKVLLGQKAYLLPNEAVPALEASYDALAKEYKENGYSEISEPEYIYLMEHSRCSEETLTGMLKMKIIAITPKHRRYFVLSKPETNPPFILPYEYVMDLRASLSKKKSKTYVANVFGMDSKIDTKLCKEDGTYGGDFGFGKRVKM